MQKPSIPKGTRDYSPSEMIRRNFIFNAIERVFKLYGYQAIETPAMENLSTLMGKYGEEGDKLLFKILNSGDFKNKVSREAYAESDSRKLSTKFSEKGLRYDLTVPFARYVVQHRNEISFPFKRYQIQPVWRADRPQKGRYREFYQCDADVIGSNSILNEFELVRIMDDVFHLLGLDIIIKYNNRKILAGIAEVVGESARMTDITIAIDKLEKIGLENVLEELSQKGLSSTAIDELKPVLQMEGDDDSKMAFLNDLLEGSESGTMGLNETRELFGYLDADPLKTDFELDITLARGLNYYTGAIFEVKSREMDIGSLCGGGRYDDLTGIFGLDEVSGVGISFGADRIYDVLLQLDRFPRSSDRTGVIMFINFGEKEVLYILPLLNRLKAHGIPSELYPEAVKMKKQMNYANQRNIQYVALAGEEEMKKGIISLKDMEKGTQEELTVEQVIELLK